MIIKTYKFDFHANPLTGDGLNEYMQETIEKIVFDRSKWIDQIIREHVPSWKIWITDFFKSRIVARLLNINLELKNTENFPTVMQTIVILNGKVIGIGNFKIKVKL